MSIDERNDETRRISDRYQTWAERPFPATLAGATFKGEEVVLLDADAAALIRAWLRHGYLGSAAATALHQHVVLLRDIANSTHGEARAYICELAEISEGVLILCSGSGD